jgi:hypothetical protein
MTPIGPPSNRWPAVRKRQQTNHSPWHASLPYPIDLMLSAITDFPRAAIT